MLNFIYYYSLKLKSTEKICRFLVDFYLDFLANLILEIKIKRTLTFRDYFQKKKLSKQKIKNT